MKEGNRLELNDRKREILKAIIDDYIQTAVPVGSRTISRKYVPRFSSATIRNEMSDIEEMGYLVQPHTSSGRIPTNKAYRLFVDVLMDQDDLEEEEHRIIQEKLSRRAGEMEKVIRRTAQILSATTHYTSLVLAPQLRRTTLKRMQLVPINKGLALVVMVTDTAVVKEAVIKVPKDIDEDTLDIISKAITKRFVGNSITDINLSMIEGFASQMDAHPKFCEELVTAMKDSIVTHDANDLITDGVFNIFNYPEYQDITKAQEFLMMMESPERLHRILDNRTKREFCITIGSENVDDVLKDCSVVTSTYRVAGRPMGTLAVIGPIRMNYGHVINVLDAMGKDLGKLMSLFISE